MPSIWISRHLDTLYVNVCVYVCEGHSLCNQHIIIKSWIQPWLTHHSCLSHCLVLILCWGYMCVRVFLLLVCESCKVSMVFVVWSCACECEWVWVCVHGWWGGAPLSSHYCESGWPSLALTSVSESGGASHRALSQRTPWEEKPLPAAVTPLHPSIPKFITKWESSIHFYLFIYVLAVQCGKNSFIVCIKPDSLNCKIF